LFRSLRIGRRGHMPDPRYLPRVCRRGWRGFAGTSHFMSRAVLSLGASVSRFSVRLSGGRVGRGPNHPTSALTSRNFVPGAIDDLTAVGDRRSLRRIVAAGSDGLSMRCRGPDRYRVVLDEPTERAFAAPVPLGQFIDACWQPDRHAACSPANCTGCTNGGRGGDNR
jgi:hypothetical protein